MLYAHKRYVENVTAAWTSDNLTYFVSQRSEKLEPQLAEVFTATILMECTLYTMSEILDKGR